MGGSRTASDVPCAWCCEKPKIGEEGNEDLPTADPEEPADDAGQEARDCERHGGAWSIRPGDLFNMFVGA